MHPSHSQMRSDLPLLLGDLCLYRWAFPSPDVGEEFAVATTQSPPQQAPQPTTPVPPAPIGDPAPLGLAGFAMTTFVLSVFNAGILPADLEPVVLPLALFYGGIAQFLAGMWEFRNNNTFGALAFTSYGAFWLSFWGLLTFIEPQMAQSLSSTAITTAVGLYLLGWTIFTAYMTVASTKVSGAVFGVFALLTATFAVLAIGDLSGGITALTRIGGYLGLATAAVAWYTSFAGVTNKTFGRAAIPVWPAGK